MSEVSRLEQAMMWVEAQGLMQCKQGVSISRQERERSKRALFDGRYVASLTGDYCRLYCDNSTKRQVTSWPHWA